MQNQGKVWLDAGKEAAIQCLCQSRKGEAKAEKCRPISEKDRDGVSKPSDKALGYEEVKGRVGTGQNRANA